MRLCGPRSLKYLLSGPLQQKLGDLWPREAFALCLRRGLSGVAAERSGAHQVSLLWLVGIGMLPAPLCTCSLPGLLGTRWLHAQLGAQPGSRGNPCRSLSSGSVEHSPPWATSSTHPSPTDSDPCLLSSVTHLALPGAWSLHTESSVVMGSPHLHPFSQHPLPAMRYLMSEWVCGVFCVWWEDRYEVAHLCWEGRSPKWEVAEPAHRTGVLATGSPFTTRIRGVGTRCFINTKLLCVGVVLSLNFIFPPVEFRFPT